MKRLLWGAVAVIVLSGTATRLTTRSREESADRRVTILADWAEVRDEAVRQGMTDEDLLERLRNSGVNGLLIGAATIQDYLWQDMSFSSRPLAETVARQLQDRGVVGVTLKKESGRFKLISSFKNWERLKDLEVGFNPELLGKARQAGFHLVLRVNQDPWLTKEKLFGDLQEISSANQELGFLLNTDDVPGGIDALADWKSLVESQNYAQLMFEFHPSKASMKLAFKSPTSTYRAHTIPSLELKDLTFAEQKSRWRRAVQERSCRFLLFHMAPNDSLAGFLETIYAIQQDLLRQGWQITWPKPRLTWSFPTFAERQLGPVAALLLAILVPVGALRYGLIENPWLAFIRIVFLSLIGACVVAAVAENPLTRLEIVPFRGIKLAFALAWIGSFLVLYPWKDIESQLHQSVRRIDVVIGLFVAGLVGYLLIRSGNAGSGWKVGWEQSVRDRLEDLLVARPRFKEFMIGYPLLILGLHMRSLTPSRRGDQVKLWVRDSRLLIGLGMIGPISMLNTFCHIHSPLSLAFLRSLNGLVAGAVIGFLLVRFVAWGMKHIEI